MGGGGDSSPCMTELYGTLQNIYYVDLRLRSTVFKQKNTEIITFYMYSI